VISLKKTKICNISQRFDLKCGKREAVDEYNAKYNSDIDHISCFMLGFDFSPLQLWVIPNLQAQTEI
jgi:hypothetical protein